jgi:hypothetical protein
MAEVVSLFSLKKSIEPAARPPRTIFASYVETLPKVIEMAEGYLLSDLSFRESWEIQRRGVFGLSELVSRAFPAGLIVELLCTHGHDLAGPINTIFETLHRSGFRYYEHDHLPPDADDLGLLLRLYPFSPQPAVHRELLQAPLRWLQDSLTQAGQIPVWLSSAESTAGPQPSLALWGHRCAAVEANLLLGLIAYNWPGYHSLVEQAIASLSERWPTQGLSATAHYVPLYSLWVTVELIARLPPSLSEATAGQVALLTQTIIDLVQREMNRPSLTAQDAAFLILICAAEAPGLAADLRPHLKLAWLTLLYKHQRYDGSWAGEPLYGTPTRGEFSAWCNSRPVTTAFCYHALKCYQTTSLSF